MKKIVIYHNSRWKKSRGAVQLLKENGVSFTIIEYLKTPLSDSEVNTLIPIPHKTHKPYKQSYTKS